MVEIGQSIFIVNKDIHYSRETFYDIVVIYMSRRPPRPINIFDEDF